MTKAPIFEINDSDGKPFKMEDHFPMVLYFYPDGLCFGIRGVPDFFQSLEGVRFHRFARLEKELPGVRELLPGFEAAEELRPDSFLQLIDSLHHRGRRDKKRVRGLREASGAGRGEKRFDFRAEDLEHD